MRIEIALLGLLTLSPLTVSASESCFELADKSKKDTLKMTPEHEAAISEAFNIFGWYDLARFVANSGSTIEEFNKAEGKLDVQSQIVSQGKEKALECLSTAFNAQNTKAQIVKINNRNGVMSDTLLRMVMQGSFGQLGNPENHEGLDQIFQIAGTVGPETLPMNQYRAEAHEMAGIPSSLQSEPVVAAPMMSAPVTEPVVTRVADSKTAPEPVVIEDEEIAAQPFHQPKAKDKVKLVKGESPQEAIVNAYWINQGYLVPVESRATFTRAVIHWANQFREKKDLGAKKKKNGKLRLTEERILANTVISMPAPQDIGFELQKVEGERKSIYVNNGDNVYKKVVDGYGAMVKMTASRFAAVLKANGISDAKKIPVGPMWLPPFETLVAKK